MRDSRPNTGIGVLADNFAALKAFVQSFANDTDTAIAIAGSIAQKIRYDLHSSRLQRAFQPKANQALSVQSTEAFWPERHNKKKR